MSTIQAVLSVVGALVGLSVVGGGLWAVFRSSAQDATITRLRAEISDYVGRIEYIEPRLTSAEQQNRLLRDLQNPSAEIGEVKGLQARTLELLNEQFAILREIEQRMPPKGAR